MPNGALMFTKLMEPQVDSAMNRHRHGQRYKVAGDLHRVSPTTTIGGVFFSQMHCANTRSSRRPSSRSTGGSHHGFTKT